MPEADLHDALISKAVMAIEKSKWMVNKNRPFGNLLAPRMPFNTSNEFIEFVQAYYTAALETEKYKALCNTRNASSEIQFRHKYQPPAHRKFTNFPKDFQNYLACSDDSASYWLLIELMKIIWMHIDKPMSRYVPGLHSKIPDGRQTQKLLCFARLQSQKTHLLSLKAKHRVGRIKSGKTPKLLENSSAGF